MDPEKAHRLAIFALRNGLVPGAAAAPKLPLKLWGLDFPNPLGMAAGFDKDAEVLDRLLRLGFGFVEAGSVTPDPQDGNPRPRIFRLIEDRALINRLGFNSAGADRAAANLQRSRARTAPGAVIGINLGRNKDSPDAGADYATGIAAFAALADYLVINVSSPNTPGLRALQDRARLEALLGTVRSALAAGGKRPPLLLKIAPDLTPEDRADIAAVALSQDLDGLIVSNTTVARPEGLRGKARDEIGGLSGVPLFSASTRLLSELYGLTGGRLPLVGVGGVSNGAEAYAKIRAGASLVQLYTAMIYEGPGLVVRILEELAALLRRDGFASVAEAVGAAHRAPAGAGAAPAASS